MLLFTACTQEVPQQQIPSVQEYEPCVLEKTFNVTKWKEVKEPYSKKTCEQLPYNFTRAYQYSEGVIDGVRKGTCIFDITNDEDMSGVFEFYVNVLKQPGGISDSGQTSKEIKAFGTERFTWNFNIDNGQTASCMLQCSDCPVRIKCFYLDQIFYSVKQIPYIVQERRNVSTTCPKQ